MTTEYKTSTISHTLEELIEMIDTEKFAAALSKRIQGIQYEADMIKYDHYSDEKPSTWEIQKLHLHLHTHEPDNFAGFEPRTISDQNSAALALGKAIFAALEQAFIEPQFLDGQGE
jgi:hypothetical protein